METIMHISSYFAQLASPTPTFNEAAFVSFFFAFLGFLVIVGTIAYIALSIALMGVFKKAGIAPWTAWVPFYNSWKLLEIGGQQGFWAVLGIIPGISIVTAVFLYISMYNIGLKLDKSGSFVVLAIFFPLVWAIWLSADDSVWNDAAGAPSLADHPLTAES